MPARTRGTCGCLRSGAGVEQLLPRLALAKDAQEQPHERRRSSRASPRRASRRRLNADRRARSPRSTNVPDQRKTCERASDTAHMASTYGIFRVAVNQAGPGSGSRSAAQRSVPPARKLDVLQRVHRVVRERGVVERRQVPRERCAAQSGSATSGCASTRSARTGRTASTGRRSGPSTPSTSSSGPRSPTAGAGPCASRTGSRAARAPAAEDDREPEPERDARASRRSAARAPQRRKPGGVEPSREQRAARAGSRSPSF